MGVILRGLMVCVCVLASAQASEKDHYEILEIARTATQQEIRSAYKRLSVTHHPDKHAGKPTAGAAAARFASISSAYEVLGDPDKRAVYDNYGNQRFTSKWAADRAGVDTATSPGFYQGSEDVVTVTDAMFRGWSFSGRARGPLARKSTWMIDFYAPWCSHCQDMVADWRRAAHLLDGEVGFAAVNCDDFSQLCHLFRIRSYPTILFLSQDDDMVEEYRGPHSADAIADFARSLGINHAISLTPTNFNTRVRQGIGEALGRFHVHDVFTDRVSVQDEGLWFVMFTAGQWCGPCQQARLPWRRLAASLATMPATRVGVMDCDRHGGLCQELRVPAYPHYRVFPRGLKDEGAVGEVLFHPREMSLTAAAGLIETVLQATQRPPAHGPLHDEL